jgi:hypothetical protein
VTKWKLSKRQAKRARKREQAAARKRRYKERKTARRIR